MQDAGILTDSTYMDTQMEKVRFNKLAIVGLVSLLIPISFFTLPGVLWKMGFKRTFLDSIYDFLGKSPNFEVLLLIIYFFVQLSLTCSILALVQIRKRRERGKYLSIITIVSIILIFSYGTYTAFQPTNCFPVDNTSQSN